MPRSIRFPLLALVAAVVLCSAGTAQAALPPASAPGTVRTVKFADSSFDAFTSNPAPGFADWMRRHIWRSVVWSPYFDARSSWYPHGWVYQDLYAIYRGSDVARQHPDWILRDGSGNPMYIPYGCSGGTCPQYAGDPGNPAFRAWWLAQARTSLAGAYAGLYVDDVNLEFRVGDGSGNESAPRDPRTGSTMTAAAWRGYVADFVEQIRRALPGEEIVHNAIWFATDARQRDPDVRREIAAADVINLERGVNDGGLTGGTGQWSLSAFLGYIDDVHAMGRAVVLDGYTETPAAREYALAAWLLISSGNDSIGVASATPKDWWPLYDLDLGAATGRRTTYDGVMRRDFADGMALVNEPGAPTRTVPLPAALTDSSGRTVTSVTLGPGSGAVLRDPSHALASQPSAVAAATAGAGGVTRTLTRLTRPAATRARPSRGAAAMRIAGVSLAGSVAHGRDGTVAVTVRRRDARGRWGRAVTLTASLDARGRFRTLARLVPGHYRARARYAGSAPARPSSSRIRTFVVRAGR